MAIVCLADHPRFKVIMLHREVIPEPYKLKTGLINPVFQLVEPRYIQCYRFNLGRYTSYGIVIFSRQWCLAAMIHSIRNGVVPNSLQTLSLKGPLVISKD